MNRAGDSQGATQSIEALVHEARLHQFADCMVSHNQQGHHIVKATPHVQVNTEWVKVTEWRFAPGAETGHHVHEYDYVVVPLTSGILRLEEPTGVRETRLEMGVSYARGQGVAHNVINANDYEFRFVEIELIRRSAAL